MERSSACSKTEEPAKAIYANNAPLQLEFSSFTQLRETLFSVLDKDPPRPARRHPWMTMPLDHTTKVELIPPSIQLHIGNSGMIGILMHRAVSHWCCIGFKVAPIQLRVIRNWQQAPLSIVYCVASISLVTFSDDHRQQLCGHQSFARNAAMVFYEQARKQMDDILFDDALGPYIIQAYFCLSYTSNFLRLSDQTRTWSSLAVIALQQQARSLEGIDDQTLLCWYRWYYIDAWVCLSRNCECLLPDELPPADHLLNEALDNETTFDRILLIQFAHLAQFMRSFIRAMRSGTLFCSTSQYDKLLKPSNLYYDLTNKLQVWYDRQPHSSKVCPASKAVQNLPNSVVDPHVDVNLHLCYHSMRLVVLYQFLSPGNQPPSQNILLDSLETNLKLLLALQHLKDSGCDQSTYHHMFFAIHNTARCIYIYDTPLRSFARDQIQMNLILMQGTQAYVNDTYSLRAQVDIIKLHLKELGITPNCAPSGDVIQPDAVANMGMPKAGTYVFRLKAQAKRLPLIQPLAIHAATFTFDKHGNTNLRKTVKTQWDDRLNIIDARSSQKKAQPSALLKRLV